MPAVLLRKGLFQALEVLAAFINRNSNLQVKMVLPSADIKILSEVESINIYRIVNP
jgi:signal transduction histidine kinase